MLAGWVVAVAVGVADAPPPSSSPPHAATPAASTAASVRPMSRRKGCGAGTRTPTTRARIWRAANYTTPQRAADQYRRTHSRASFTWTIARYIAPGEATWERPQGGQGHARGRERIHTVTRSRPGARAGSGPAANPRDVAASARAGREHP